MIVTEKLNNCVCAQNVNNRYKDNFFYFQLSLEKGEIGFKCYHWGSVL